MKLPLDTYIALWAAEGAPQLSATAVALIEPPRTRCTSAPRPSGEIATKYRKGNLPVHPRDARSAFRLAGFTELPISSDHVEGVAALPDFPDHADPFDRVMVAQVLHEGMPLVSADPKVWRYHSTLMLRA